MIDMASPGDFNVNLTYQIDMKSSNRFVRNARKKLGLTQAAFARELGVTLGSVARYERDGYRVPETVRLAIEGLLLKKRHKQRS